jgi:hypothetical protein
VDAFKKMDIKNSKNWFTVKDGAVQLQEFKHSYDGIDMTVGGSHKLTGDMDYKIVAKIPRSKIGKNPLGAAANSGLDFLSGEAAKYGVNVNAGEFINVQINLGGVLADPKVSFKILGSDGTKTVKDAVEDKVKEEAQKQIDKAKAEAEAKLQAEKDKLKAEADKKAEELKQQAIKKAEAEAKRAAENAAKKAGDDAAKKAAEEAKKKLEELKNPFKKKKKEGG